MLNMRVDRKECRIESLAKLDLLCTAYFTSPPSRDHGITGKESCSAADDFLHRHTLPQPRARKDPALRRRCSYLYGDVFDRVRQDVLDFNVVDAALKHLMLLFCRSCFVFIYTFCILKHKLGSFQLQIFDNTNL